VLQARRKRRAWIFTVVSWLAVRIAVIVCFFPRPADARDAPDVRSAQDSRRSDQVGADCGEVDRSPPVPAADAICRRSAGLGACAAAVSSDFPHTARLDDTEGAR
jgi:hypothetical protein